MSTLNLNATAATSEGTAQQTRTISSSGRLLRDAILPPAKVGQLTTRTNNTDGVITLTAGHGLVTGRMDIYWTVNGVKGSRYGVTGTVVGDVCTITGGGGDNLPVVNSAVTVAVPVLYPLAYSNALIQAFVAMCQVQACVVVRSAVPANLVAAQIDGSTDAYIWDASSGVTSPFTADLADVYLSQGDSTQSMPVYAIAYIN